MDNKKGISLISLVITIIVIIILAAIVIFNGFGTAESAQFAKFTQEYSSFGEEIQQRYLNAKVQSSLRGESKTDSEIYAEMAGAEELQIADVLDGKVLSEDLEGTKCYKLSDNRSFYEGDSGTYITDKGEIFTLPGYRYNQNGEERRYVSASKYYPGDDIENPNGDSTDSPQEEMVLNENDSGEAMWNLLKAIANEIAARSGEITKNTTTVSGEVNGIPYSIEIGQKFSVNYDGRNEKVIVLGFNHDTLASDSNKKAGISFQFERVLTTGQMNATNTNKGGWDASKMQNETMTEIFGNIADATRKQIVTVKKPSMSGECNHGAINTGWNLSGEAKDDLWLLSCSEIWPQRSSSGHYAYAQLEEGKQYAYFKTDMNITATNYNSSNSKLVKQNSEGTNFYWWLRSPSYRYRLFFCTIGTDGHCSDGTTSLADGGIAPGFCI